MIYARFSPYALLVAALLCAPAWGEAVVAPSDAEAEAAFKQAQEQFKAMAAGTGVEDAPAAEAYEVAVFSDPDKQFHPGGKPENVALGHVKLVIDVEDSSLREVVNEIVGQAADYTGPWTVKWRLKPENMAIADERVNLTAEAGFEQFVALLTEKVRNMTGVHLFMTAYEQARVILITDTY
ncbi:MAG: hypothetical protein H6922_02345 [Pseudomonadaceae bacterium]|nr:hypothetical protein [Pseudomonadaceae bacterium]